jgi:hypothetical protein
VLQRRGRQVVVVRKRQLPRARWHPIVHTKLGTRSLGGAHARQSTDRATRLMSERFGPRQSGCVEPHDGGVIVTWQSS